MRLPWAAAALAALLSCTAGAGQGTLTVLYTGDNGGEVAPCG